MGILARNGAKQQYIVKEIEKHFPPQYDFYIEPFFGAGGMFFQKKYRSKYSILNDIDQDIYNFFSVLRSEPSELIETIELLPNDETLFYKIVRKEIVPKNEIERAAWYYFINDRSFLGKRDLFKYSFYGDRKTEEKIKEGFRCFCNGVTFLCVDFRRFLDGIHLRHKRDYTERAFVYADPPYLGTDTKSYYGESWKFDDFVDLCDCLEKFGSRFVISENGSNEKIVDETKRRGYFQKDIYAKEQNGKKRMESIFANYELDLDIFHLKKETKLVTNERVPSA